ncbi:MAG: hypothetical protein LRZ87_03675 [Methanocellales archaeon]|nr:hypothetical protein [Methanocellales archaeon]
MLDISLSTVNHALKPLVKMGTVKVNPMNFHMFQKTLFTAREQMARSKPRRACQINTWYAGEFIKALEDRINAVLE